MFEQIYNEYLLHKNEENFKERYAGKESWYHASGAGFCSRKLYYESVERPEPTNPAPPLNARVMRLGTVIHQDIQDAIIYYNNIYNNNNINKDITEKILSEDYLHKCSFVVEGEIQLPELNVRGFYDVLEIDETDPSLKRISLLDIKTSSRWNYDLKFSKKAVIPQENRNHFLQLGTYALGIEKEYGNVDEMSLLYYNKDNSKMAKQNVPLNYIHTAKRYWKAINDEHKKGLPVHNLGVSPAYKWCCGYCQFKDHCKPPSFK